MAPGWEPWQTHLEQVVAPVHAWLTVVRDFALTALTPSAATADEWSYGKA